MKKTVNIEGMMCKHCAKHVSDALNGLDGVTATVDLENKCAYVETEADDAVLTKAVEDAGYKVVSIA